MANVTKSIGTNGRDYSTINAWEADLNNSGIYSAGDFATGECYNDSVFNESVDFVQSGQTVGIKRIILTAPAGQRHNGVANTGVTILDDGAGTWTLDSDFNINGGPLLLFEWLDVDGGANIGISSNGIVTFDSASGILRNCILHESSGNGVAGSVWTVNFSPLHTIGYKNAFNNIIYNTTAGGSVSNDCLGILPAQWGFSQEIKNNTIFRTVNYTPSGIGSTYGIENLDVVKVQYVNNISVKTSGTNLNKTRDFYDTELISIADYNLSSDNSAPGPNSVRNVVINNQFVSTIRGSEDLHLQDISDARGVGSGLGIAPDGINIDIDGTNRNIYAAWDIGADQYVAGRTSLIFMSMW